MSLDRIEIPYGAYWSTPFAKWQGRFQHLHSVEFAAHVARAELGQRDIPAETFDFGVLGMTVPQKHSFYGAPWAMGLIGAPTAHGPTINQACASSVRCLDAAAREIAAGGVSTALVLTCDRTSNGPHVYYPAPSGPGGTGAHEDWVLDNFGCDPLGRHAMVQTAENVAAKYAISREEQHDVVLMRYGQYERALAGDRAFQKRYMTLPFTVPRGDFRKTAGEIEGDEGIFPTTREALEKLEPVVPDGTVTFGGQTHPADGNAALVLTTAERAQSLSRDAGIRIGLAGFGSARAELAHMPEAIVPASERALSVAGIDIDDVAAFKSHNPFAVNDIVFSRETGVALDRLNNYGCSLIWGHPQGPTGLRTIIELIEELVLIGGGYGLFQGCAAGDTAMAVVIQVDDRSAAKRTK
jgi:acetyl-CoA acetyltransferase